MSRPTHLLPETGPEYEWEHVWGDMWKKFRTKSVRIADGLDIGRWLK